MLQKHPECYRYQRGWCDGTRWKIVCACGATGEMTCAARANPDQDLPECCTEIKVSWTEEMDAPW